jgi:hypothetical protein
VAQPDRLYNTKSNRSVPHIRRHSRFGCTVRHPIGQFPTSGGTARSAAQRDIQSVNSLRLPMRRRSLSVGRPSSAGHEFLRNSYRRIPHIQQTPSSASHEFLRNPWSCGFAARCAVRLGPTGGDPSTSIGLRPKMAAAARTKRAGASWKVEDFPHIRRHSRFGWTTRNPIGQFPPSGGTARSAVQYDTQSVSSLHPAAQPLRLYNATPNRSIP